MYVYYVHWKWEKNDEVQVKNREYIINDILKMQSLPLVFITPPDTNTKEML